MATHCKFHLWSIFLVPKDIILVKLINLFKVPRNKYYCIEKQGPKIFCTCCLVCFHVTKSAPDILSSEAWMLWRFVIVVNCRFAGTTSTNKNGTVGFCDKCFHSYFRRCGRLKCMLILRVKKGLLAAMTWPCMHLDQEWHPWQHLSDAAFLCTQTLAEMQGNRKLNEEAQFIFTIVSGGMLEELLPQKWGGPRGLCAHKKKLFIPWARGSATMNLPQLCMSQGQRVEGRRRQLAA